MKHLLNSFCVPLIFEGIVVLSIFSYVFKKRKFDIGYLINGLLGSLVGITGK